MIQPDNNGNVFNSLFGPNFAYALHIGYLGKSGAHLLLRDEIDVMIEGKTEVFVYRSK